MGAVLALFVTLCNSKINSKYINRYLKMNNFTEAVEYVTEVMKLTDDFFLLEV